jgi:hypothetical protein
VLASTAAEGGPRLLALVGGPAKDQPLPTVVRCRERRQDVAPVEGLVYEHPQRYLMVVAPSSVLELKESSMGNCAGVDWASEKHDVLIEDPAGEELLGATFAHDEDGISALCAALVCFEVEVVAIERPGGLRVGSRSRWNTSTLNT